MRLLRFSKAARSDLVAIAVYLASQTGSRAVGEAFARRLRQKCEYLASLPGTIGRARPELHPEIRSTAFGNYVIFFRYDGDTVFQIVTILEGHRDIDRHFEEEAPASD